MVGHMGVVEGYGVVSGINAMGDIDYMTDSRIEVDEMERRVGMVGLTKCLMSVETKIGRPSLRGGEKTRRVQRHF